MVLTSKTGDPMKEIRIVWICDHENIKSTSFVLFIATVNLGMALV